MDIVRWYLLALHVQTTRARLKIDGSTIYAHKRHHKAYIAKTEPKVSNRHIKHLVKRIGAI